MKKILIALLSIVCFIGFGCLVRFGEKRSASPVKSRARLAGDPLDRAEERGHPGPRHADVLAVGVQQGPGAPQTAASLAAAGAKLK